MSMGPALSPLAYFVTSSALARSLVVVDFAIAPATPVLWVYLLLQRFVWEIIAVLSTVYSTPVIHSWPVHVPRGWLWWDCVEEFEE